MKRREDLTSPRAARRRPGVAYDADAFGRFSEGVARYFGTARFLAIQTVLVILWIAINVGVVALRWDPYPFILLNLAFSTQAAYAAPLILLAQNRQEQRDRVQAELDREVAERTQNDTEFLAREIAGVRLVLNDAVTGEELRDELAGVMAALDDVAKRIDALARDQATPGADDAATGRA